MAGQMPDGAIPREAIPAGTWVGFIVSVVVEAAWRFVVFTTSLPKQIKKTTRLLKGEIYGHSDDDW